MEDLAQIQTLITLCAAALPILRSFVAGAVGKAAENLPPTPSGRPRTLTSGQMRRINEKVVALILKGVQTGDAQTRVAQQLGLGKRTIQTVWSKRRQLAAQPFQSMEDVWKLVEGPWKQMHPHNDAHLAS